MTRYESCSIAASIGALVIFFAIAIFVILKILTGG